VNLTDLHKVLVEARASGRCVWLRGYRSSDGKVADYLLSVHDHVLYPRLIAESAQFLRDVLKTMDQGVEHELIRSLQDSVTGLTASMARQAVETALHAFVDKLNKPPPAEDKIRWLLPDEPNLQDAGPGAFMLTNVLVESSLIRAQGSKSASTPRVGDTTKQAADKVAKALPLAKYGPRFKLTSDSFTSLLLSDEINA
jgi:hypothetical protein